MSHSECFTSEERFNYCVEFLLRHEGSYSNNPHDPGGPTNFGITQEDVNKYWAPLSLPKDVRNMTEEKAKEFYKRVWWDPNHYNAINSLSMACKIFDTAVNIGVIRTNELVQRSCNHCGHQLSIDGILGGKTLGALNEIALHSREEDWMMDFCEEQKSFYELLIFKNPELKEFEKGWLTRAAWTGT